jgi:integrase
VSGGRYKEGAPKTDSGKRIVPILPDAEVPITELEDRAVVMGATHLFVGAGKRASRMNTKGERVTVKAAGAIGYSELSRELREACAIAVEQGVIPEPFTWHALRHTFCSALLSAGVSEDKVASWAGHSSSEVTKRVYSVALPGNLEAIASEVGAAIAEYFGNRRTPRSVRDKKAMEIMLKNNPELAAAVERKKGRGSKAAKPAR